MDSERQDVSLQQRYDLDNTNLLMSTAVKKDDVAGNYG